MNIIYKSKTTKVIGSTPGGDEVGQARGRMGSKGGRPLIVPVPGLSCWERFLEPRGGNTDSKRSVA
jgi:hypothetical protein